MNKYFLNHNIKPKTVFEGSIFAITIILMPITFIFELCVVLPTFHEPGTFIYIFTWIAATFILINSVGNLMLCMLQDTSIKNIVLMPPLEEDLRRNWRFCEHCQVLAPPRSWHCDTCKICILKRDHHCLFTSCCVGHRNQRYFFMFVVHICLGGIYAFCYNSLYIWWLNADTYLNGWTLLKMFAPFLTLIRSVSWTNIYLVIYEINIMAMLLAIGMLLYHGSHMLKGSVTHERSSNTYDLGWKENLAIALGVRWYLVWLSPFLKSELPHDGIYWDNLLQSTLKNR